LGAPINCVVAAPAEQNIIAVAAINGVIIAPTGDVVVITAARKCIVTVFASDRVAAAATSMLSLPSPP
jgi:hypothetical protein